MLDSVELLSLADDIHFVITKMDPNSETHLISSKYVNWRSVLAAPLGKESLSLEMMGVGEC